LLKAVSLNPLPIPLGQRSESKDRSISEWLAANRLPSLGLLQTDPVDRAAAGSDFPAATLEEFVDYCPGKVG
jgi:hypothetical protein